TLLFSTDTATTEIYTLSLHDALPILLDGVVEEVGQHLAKLVRIRRDRGQCARRVDRELDDGRRVGTDRVDDAAGKGQGVAALDRSEEHTSELQSLAYLVCRLLLEKKK